MSPSSLPAVADVVVVGAGHNALVCAAYLAEAGLEVVVLEGGDIIGGNTVTEELTLPGFRHDSCASAHVVIQSNPLLRDDELGLLSRYGLRYVHTDPAVVVSLSAGGAAGGDAVVVHRDLERTAAELARWSPPDGAALVRMMTDWGAGLGAAHARWSAGLPPDGGPASSAYQALRRRSAWEVVHSTFEHEVSRRVLAWLAFATIQPPQRPGTGALPAAIANGRLRYGWATPVGGSDALPRALAAHLAEHGGRVVPGTSVVRIESAGGRAAAVVTVDGQRVAARRAIVSSAHLATLPDLLDAPPPEDLRRAAASWRPGLGLFAVHLAVRADPAFRTADGPVRSVAGGLGSPAGLRRQVAGVPLGRVERDDPWLLVVAQTVVDPRRAPDGGATVKLLTTAPAAPEGAPRWSPGATEEYAGQLVRLVARRVQGLAESDILGCVGESPTDLAARNPHNRGGSCHGGEVEVGGEVLPGWPSHRTGVPGLYLTGATTHPGGSVSGRPGRNAARVVLSDLGLDPAKVIGAP